MEKIENLIAEIEKLTVLELADLVKAIEEKFGVSAAAAAVVAAPGAAAGAAASRLLTYFLLKKKVGKENFLRNFVSPLAVQKASSFDIEKQ